MPTNVVCRLVEGCVALEKSEHHDLADGVGHWRTTWARKCFPICIPTQGRHIKLGKTRYNLDSGGVLFLITTEAHNYNVILHVWVCLLITRHSPFHTGRGLSYSMCLAKITQGTAQRRTAADADGGDYGPKYDYTAAAATTQNGASASAPGPDTTTLTATTAHSIQELTQTADQRLAS